MRRKIKANKKVRNATSKVYKGIKFRSKLELFTYKKLEEAGIKSLYEERKFVLMEGFRFEQDSIEPSNKRATKGEYINNSDKVRDITYTPDFVDPNGKWIIEVKGFANDVFPLKWKLFKNYLQKLGDPPVLYLPKNQKQVLETIELINQLGSK
tara:strand:- start:5303 stop:5761 length:459 start_codon:yes stop_codon:yes gene_type:complete